MAAGAGAHAEGLPGGGPGSPECPEGDRSKGMYNVHFEF